MERVTELIAVLERPILAQDQCQVLVALRDRNGWMNFSFMCCFTILNIDALLLSQLRYSRSQTWSGTHQAASLSIRVVAWAREATCSRGQEGERQMLPETCILVIQRGEKMEEKLVSSSEWIRAIWWTLTFVRDCSRRVLDSSVTVGYSGFVDCSAMNTSSTIFSTHYFPFEGLFRSFIIIQSWI